MTRLEREAAVAVVGGGISGLSAAHALSQSPGLRVVLLEASDRLGGVIRTDEIEGQRIEAGPDAFLESPAMASLCDFAGLGADDLIRPTVFGAYLWTRARLRKLPPEVVYGLPGAPLSVARRGLLSPWGALRAFGDVVLPGPLDGPDVAVGSFVGRRMGSEVVDRLVDPLMAGRRAGLTGTMSLAAANEAVDELARSHRSLLVGLRKMRRSGGLESGPPPFRTPRGGMRTLVEGLRTRLRSTEIRTCTAVETMSAGGEKGYRLGLRGGDALEAEAVVVATPAPAAATLMSGVDEPVARALRTVRFADTAVATLVYPPGDLQAPPDGSGFLVPLAEGKTIAACTWYSHKWPRAAPPDGGVVLRAFVGRAGREDALDLDDGALTDAIAADLNDAMGISEAPRRWRVSRWDCSLPEYTVGHGERVEHMSKMLESHPRVALAGAAYAGSGMPDCVTSGFAAATKVIRGLRRDGNRLVPTTGKEGT